MYYIGYTYLHYPCKNNNIFVAPKRGYGYRVGRTIIIIINNIAQGHHSRFPLQDTHDNIMRVI